MIEKLKNLPVPVLPTMVGAMTLSNVLSNYAVIGNEVSNFVWVRNVTFIAATVVLFCYLLKVIFHFDTVKKEYSQTVPCSLYAGFFMMMMLLGSYYFQYSPLIGKGLWLAAIVMHAIHICWFTYKNILTNRNWDTTVPSWFVTYNGIMVSAVCGGAMNMPALCKIVTYYGICIFTLLVPFMIYRLFKYEIKPGMYHTQAILLAPSSLSLACYLTYIENPMPLIVYYLYFAVICALVFILIKLPSFFDVPFTPAFAGLTFPMAIGCVATTKFLGFAKAAGLSFAPYLGQLGGFQVYFTCGLLFYVLLNFVRMLVNSYKA